MYMTRFQGTELLMRPAFCCRSILNDESWRLAYETPHHWHREVENACRPKSEKHQFPPINLGCAKWASLVRRNKQSGGKQSSGLISADDCIRIPMAKLPDHQLKKARTVHHLLSSLSF